MRVIIPCAGEGDRWQMYHGIPKQLIEIEGQTLLERTVGLCKKMGVDDIWVVALPGSEVEKAALKLGVDVAEKTQHPYPVGIDKVMSSEFLWDGTTVVLFGDVYFTKEALDIILTDERDTPITFYGRLHGSNITGKNGGAEVYGLRFEPRGYEQLKAHCEYIRWSIQAGYIDWRKDVIQTVLASVATHTYDKEKCEGSEYLVTIDDWTEDFDRPKDYILWMKNRCP